MINKKRIALCVEKCKELTDEALEKDIIKYMIDWFRTHDYITAYRRGEIIPKEEAEYMGVKVFKKEGV